MLFVVVRVLVLVLDLVLVIVLVLVLVLVLAVAVVVVVVFVVCSGVAPLTPDPGNTCSHQEDQANIGTEAIAGQLAQEAIFLLEEL